MNKKRISILSSSSVISLLLLFILSGLTYITETDYQRDENPSKILQSDVDESKYYCYTFSRNNKTSIKVNIVLREDNEKYQKRYAKAIEAALGFFEKYITDYSFSNVVVTDKVNYRVNSQNSLLIIVDPPVFSPIETYQPEDNIIYSITKGFINSQLNVPKNEVLFFEGLTLYITQKIMQNYFGQPAITFNLFSHYPVYGLNLLSYNEIPLIYSLGKYYYPEGASSYAKYIQAPQMFAVGDSIPLPDDHVYRQAAYTKSHLVMIAIERYIGFDNMMSLLMKLFSNPAGKEKITQRFLELLQESSGEDYNWLTENLFKNSPVFDYRIKDIERTSEPDVYQVNIERLGDGIFNHEIALYTNKDTLFQKWNGIERFKVVVFKTNNEVIGAEIDPRRKNILDLDYSNNSYFIKHQYGGSFSLSFRWFFWMQNLLLILGSIA